MLTYDNIRKMTDPRTFEKGRQIRHSKNKILDFRVQTERRYKDLSKADYLVEAKVKGSNGEIYDVELSVDSDRGGIRRAYCDCLAFAKYNGLCKHCVAAACKCQYKNVEKVENNNVCFCYSSAACVSIRDRTSLMRYDGPFMEIIVE